MITSILTDIEGTTSSVSFVYDVLFPYAEKALPDFVRTYQQHSLVVPLLQQVNVLVGKNLTLDECILQLLQWMEQDQKIPVLKSLQGMVWEIGYERGDFQSHVYPDAYYQLNAWHQAGYALYVYSSGSSLSQNLFFKHTVYGDMSHLFSGFFDGYIGPKIQAASYQGIMQKTGIKATNWLFLSDSLAEVDAARQAQMSTYLIARDVQLELPITPHRVIASFNEVKLA